MIVCSVGGELSATERCGYLCGDQGFCTASEDLYCRFKLPVESVAPAAPPETIEVFTLVFPDGKTVFVEAALGKNYALEVVKKWRERNSHLDPGHTCDATLITAAQKLFKSSYLDIVTKEDEEVGNDW